MFTIQILTAYPIVVGLFSVIFIYYTVSTKPHTKAALHKLPFTILNIEQFDGLQLCQVIQVSSAAHVRIQALANFNHTNWTTVVIW